MTEKPQYQIRSELRIFLALVTLNMIFGALAVAYGIWFIVLRILGAGTGSSIPFLLTFSGIIPMISFGLGLAWIKTSVGILRDLLRIRRDLASDTTGRDATFGIIRMTSHYRENRKMFHTMTVVCTLGGIIFFLQAILCSLEYLHLAGNTLAFALDSRALLPAMLATLAVALTSLACSALFHRYSQAVDLRISKIERSEELLKNALSGERR